jgi:adenylate cyclase
LTDATTNWRSAAVREDRTQKVYGFEGYTLDIIGGSLRAGDRDVQLRPKSFEVLRYLIENSGSLVTKDQLIKAIWPDVAVTDDSLTQCVSEVRQAIGDSTQTIVKTVPRRGYRFVAPVVVVPSNAPSKSGAPTTEISSGPPLPVRPSIAVLALANLSGEPQQDYFCDGITEDIITELSRFSELMVIARNSTFQYKGRAVDIRQIGKELGARYVLEGSVRRVGDRVRITAQLIDATTGAHRWADRYDREISNIFAVQDEVTRAIVTVLAIQVNKAEAERALLKPAATWEAYDYYLRGVETYFAHVTDPGTVPISEARSLLDKSISLDSKYARAYAMLCRTRIRTFWDPVDSDYLDPVGIELAYELARKAVQLGPNLPAARLQRGLTLLFRKRPMEAVAEFDCALALNPNYTEPQIGFGFLLAGQATKAVEILTANVSLDPLGFPIRHLYMGQAFYSLHRYQEAIPHLQESTAHLPDLWANYVFLAAANGQLRQLDEAKAAITQLFRTNPAVTADRTTQSLPYNSPIDVEHIHEGLRLAGLS